MKRLCASIALTATLLNALSAPAQQQTQGKSGEKKEPASEQKVEPGVSINPAAVLIREPAVHADLQLNDAQKKAALELAAALNEQVWMFRDVPPGSGIGADKVRQINDILDKRLKEILSASQQDRVEQIVVRLEGPTALARPNVAQRLALTAMQREKISTLFQETQKSATELQKQAVGNKNLSDIARKMEKLKTDLRKDLLAVLTPTQRNRWTSLQGKPFDSTKLGPLTAKAPELRGVDTWINSNPLSFAELRGQVVVLHFWTFG